MAEARPGMSCYKGLRAQFCMPLLRSIITEYNGSAWQSRTLKHLSHPTSNCVPRRLCIVTKVSSLDNQGPDTLGGEWSLNAKEYSEESTDHIQCDSYKSISNKVFMEAYNVVRCAYELVMNTMWVYIKLCS